MIFLRLSFKSPCINEIFTLNYIPKCQSSETTCTRTILSPPFLLLTVVGIYRFPAHRFTSFLLTCQISHPYAVLRKPLRKVPETVPYLSLPFIFTNCILQSPAGLTASEILRTGFYFISAFRPPLKMHDFFLSKLPSESVIHVPRYESHYRKYLEKSHISHSLS